MTPDLAPIAPRLGHLLRLLGSPHDGEALAACRALGRTLAGAGASLHDLADAIERSPAPAVVYRPTSSASPPPRGTVAWISARRHEVSETLQRGLTSPCLTGWERNFAKDIIPRLHDPRSRLSHQQAEVIERLLLKLAGSRS